MVFYHEKYIICPPKRYTIYLESIFTWQVLLIAKWKNVLPKKLPTEELLTKVVDPVVLNR